MKYFLKVELKCHLCVAGRKESILKRGVWFIGLLSQSTTAKQHTFLFAFLKRDGSFSFYELKYKQQRQKQMNRVNVSSIKIACPLLGLLMTLVKFWDLTMWHLPFVMHKSYIFQDIAQIPSLWFIRPKD